MWLVAGFVQVGKENHPCILVVNIKMVPLCSRSSINQGITGPPAPYLSRLNFFNSFKLGKEVMYQWPDFVKPVPIGIIRIILGIISKMLIT